ncbi:MAG: hypothetical protein FJ096_01635 [Deltaproteobacteria bacterium]|nr:hypothetical protein [Deltaproteobacteria bacterium]
MASPEHPFLSEPFIASEIERALAGVAALLDPVEFHWLREALATELAEDAELRALLADTQAKSVDVSGERLVPWLESETADDPARTG